MNTVRGPNRYRKPLRVDQIASKIKVAQEVWLATSANECEKGTLSPAPLWYKLPGSQRFLEVFRVDAQRPFLRSESGTAVLDAEDGSWYGHIIAADDDTSTAYMLLAVDIIRSIASTIDVSETSLSLTERIEITEKETNRDSVVFKESEVCRFNVGMKENEQDCAHITTTSHIYA